MTGEPFLLIDYPGRACVPRGGDKENWAEVNSTTIMSGSRRGSSNTINSGLGVTLRENKETIALGRPPFLFPHSERKHESFDLRSETDICHQNWEKERPEVAKVLWQNIKTIELGDARAFFNDR